MIWPNIGVQKIKLTAVGPTGCFNIYERCIDVIEIPTAQVGINDIAVNDTVTICKGSE